MYWLARMYVEAGIIWGTLRLGFLAIMFVSMRRELDMRGITVTLKAPGSTRAARYFSHLKVVLFGFYAWPLSIWSVIRSMRGAVTAFQMGVHAQAATRPEDFIEVVKATAKLALHCDNKKCHEDPCTCACEGCMKAKET